MTNQQIIQEHELTKDRFCKNCGMIKEDLGFNEGCQKNPNFLIVHEFWDTMFLKISQLDSNEVTVASIKMLSILKSKDQEKEKALKKQEETLTGQCSAHKQGSIEVFKAELRGKIEYVFEELSLYCYSDSDWNRILKSKNKLLTLLK